MSTTTTVPIPRSTFRTKPPASCPFKSGCAMRFSYIPSQRSRRGAARASGHDPHALLGVAHGATTAEIKKAYRRLALRYHPDVCAGDRCSARFQHINSAYEALMSAAAPPSAQSEEDPEGFAGLDEELWEEWMGWEGAGTLDFSSPSDAAN